MPHQLHDFYCTPIINENGNKETRYQIWERGEAVGDSITPSIYCKPYREHLVNKIASLVEDKGSVFSIGCGNAFVEAELVNKGLSVSGIDFNEEAVELAALKGVDACVSDYYDLKKESLFDFDVVYADGLIGHLYENEGGLDRFFHKLKTLTYKSWIVLSNDAPLEDETTVMPNKMVNGFWLLSTNYIKKSLERFGYIIHEDYYYTYERPKSGTRKRSICIAKSPGRNK
ncbi:methyltransferase domain-containing protein [Sphingobacterium sp. DR205]|uniref:class I SAM-dependent methyltransferase n=1 Tax=Sphingobacterium sp. DR205 TaxID=2713573 RepID=UPI0013E4EDBB|nr:methyltransferase domain-containing protein [Sphingobacterium sp. DR205]QIH33419.1 methyltransferase domain-containing protein [Sphingobacterium sp. DR205]